jgi:selenocysteine lyase/cysteine desulfurase
MIRMGLEERGGAVRVSLVHYNTLEEIDRLGVVLESLGV